MAERPNAVPEWATDPGADVVEPPAGKKAQGWVQGEKPPAGYFNWLFRLLTGWVAWFADKIKGRGGFGIDVPEGIATTHLYVDRGSSDGPGIESKGYGSDAAGGHFSGNAPVRAIADSGSAAAVYAETAAGASGPALAAVISRPDPVRGALYMPPIPILGNPGGVRGDIYYNGFQGALLFYDGGSWVPFAHESGKIRRHVLGMPGEPSLHPDWSSYGDVSFYWDGRRVWLSGRVSRGVDGSSEVIFVLPEAFRPDSDVWLPTIHVSGQTSAEVIVVTTTGEVRLGTAVTGVVSMLLLDGLSFERWDE